MQMSIRGVDDKLARALKERAAREDTSVNKVVIRLLRDAVEGGTPRGGGGPDSRLEEFFGVWSKDDAREFEQRTASFDEVDEEMWR